MFCIEGIKDRTYNAKFLKNWEWIITLMYPIDMEMDSKTKEIINIAIGVHVAYRIPFTLIFQRHILLGLTLINLEN
jgi:hypothetical protein